MQNSALRRRFACILMIGLILAVRLSGQYAQSNDSLIAPAAIVSSSNAANPGGPNPEPWNAQWITHPNAHLKDEIVLHFRKTVELAETPQHFVVDVSADQQFMFSVNQQLVGFGPSRSDLPHWKFATYDLAPYLHSGINTLAATVWTFGMNTALAQISERTAFLLHGHSVKEELADSNATWQVEQETGITSITPPLGGYVAEPGERLDARLFDWSWNTQIQSANWVGAVALGRGALRGETVLSSHKWDAEAPNNWQLEADSLPPMEMTLSAPGRAVRISGIPELTPFPGQPMVVPPHITASILIDNSHLTTGFPELTVSSGAASTVRLTYAEALADAKGQKGNRNEIAGKHIEGLFDEFLPDGSENRTFTPLAFRAWRYLQLDIKTGDEPLRIEQLRTWFSAFPFEARAKFQSDDPELAKIWEIGWRTARLDAHDTYMDTPYWERLQYVGDTRIQALISYTAAGDDRLARQAIRAFDNSRIPDGLTQSRYPTAQIQMIPTFSLLWVGMLHDFWMYRSDADFVRSEIPGTRTVLGWFLREQRADGLLPKIPWWPFVDWGRDYDWGVPPQDDDGGSAIIALQYIEALRYGAEMEGALGDPHIAEIYRAAAARTAQAILKRCWNRQYGLIADTPAQKHFSQHANILGVWLDVVPSGWQKGVLIKILSASDKSFASDHVPPMTLATYYFRFYLARALQHAGMGDRYLQLLDPWREMMSVGLTTWAEAPEPSRSDSHAWSAHPNYDLLTIIAGIRPKSPGYKTVTIEPHFGSLRHVSAAMPHPDGPIEVEYDRTSTGVKAHVTLPQSVTGELLWKGKSSALHGGSQDLTLPRASLDSANPLRKSDGTKTHHDVSLACSMK